MKRWIGFLVAAMVLIGGAAFSFYLSVRLRDGDRSARELAFEREAVMVSSAMQQSINRVVEEVDSLARLFDVTTTLTREGFRRFTARHEQHRGELQALEWVPRVSGADRPAFEAAARRQGLSSFRITDLVAPSSQAEAAERAEYFPVFYIEPFEGNEAALGLDLSSEAARREALEGARRSGEMVTSPPLTLVQETDGQGGILIVHPVYERDGDPASAGRTQALKGLAVGVLRVGGFLEGALEALHRDVVHYRVYDGTPEDGVLLHECKDWAAASSDAANRATGEPTALRWSTTLELPGRTWTVVFEPVPGGAFAAASLPPTIVLWVSLFASVLLGGYVLAATERSARVHALLVEVREANVKLESEMQAKGAAESSLRASEAKYRGLFDAGSDAVFVYELLESGEPGKIIEANSQACERFGYERDELLGLSPSTICDPPITGDPVRATASKRGEGRVVLEQVHKDRGGSQFPVEVSANLVDLAGERLVIVVARDISERKKAEEELRESEEKLRQAQKLQAIGQLAGGVAHDFNNVLMVITGFSELILGRLGADDPSRKHVETIQKAAFRAASLTQQLLAFSRRQIMQPALIEINETVREVEAMLRRLIGENIEILSRLDPAAGTIKADPGQIHQILINLATNARDAMPRGGRLLIETQNVHVAQGSQRSRPEFAPGDYLMLAVSDTGAGMSPATLSRIFEPFFTTKEQGKGTGLGLATVYGIVKQSAGYIYAYSEPGTGTPLKIYLPRESKDARELAGPEAQAKPSAGVGTILVVEDEDAVRELVEIILAKQGYHVLSTSRGREALALCQSRAGGIDLLITDMVMPGMSGRETAEAVRAVMPGIRVLYMTGYTEDFASINGMVSRGEAIMQKPITAADLLERVGALLQAQ